MKEFLIALQFLTVFPITIRPEIKGEDFGKSLRYFPIIGGLIGILLCLSLFLLGFLPGLVKGACILIISIIITGGIHLDGFADACDGFYGSNPKEKILQIMRDSHIGVMGVIGVICLLFFKFSLIVSIPQGILWKSLIMMAVFARWSQCLACYVSCYARKDGKAKHFIEHAKRREVYLGGVFTLTLFLMLMQIKGVILFFISILPIFLFINYIKRRIGGMSGDTIGAVSEIGEVAILFGCLFY
ncbi:adenosylcobinamide-GDP ribazoletransferase [Candidatus Omnitrophota bacterium]